MGVRIATQQDIPALKQIILKGLSEDSVFKYCFPSTRSETASNHVETVLKRIIDPENASWLCFVVDAPKTHDPVSLAICQTIHQNADGQKGVAEQAEQVFGLDADDNQTKTIKRLSALQQGITETQQKYLVRHTEVIFLHAVITHPHWIRQGFAKTLSKQTLQVARQKGAVVVALASPFFTGYVFYSGTSFANCGRTKVETDNDIENLELQIMVCTPPSPSSSDAALSWTTWVERKCHPLVADASHTIKTLLLPAPKSRGGARSLTCLVLAPRHPPPSTMIPAESLTLRET
ncbi:hypothetical protein NXS19_002864 [Fusarium pseudograminearum]|nr:hypothetical protein NXS19_002864 [Fusarium pseudograminearum]